MADNYPPFAAHVDGNQYPTIMGVVGSAGTADVRGTAQPLPVGVRADTGALYVYNLGPAGAVTVAGTDPTSYLPARLTDGTNFYNASGGAGGGTTVNIATGTQQTLGTVGVVNNVVGGTITRVENGSIVVVGFVSSQLGTLAQVTAVNNIVTGTLAALTTVANLTNGSANILTGTITSVTNLAAGTVQINPKPAQLGTSFVAVGTTGAAVWGTLIAAAGVGTKQYVSNVDVVVTSGTVDVAVANTGIDGSVGAGVLVRGQFPAGGGIAKHFNPINPSGANGTLSYWLGGAGTVAITINYWQGV